MTAMVRREAGGQHMNVSTPSPQPLQSGNTTPESSSNGNTTVYIVTGAVVPLVLIGIGVLLFYICYRKKYPVRMVMGKDFAKFSNPAYNKRNSTLTLVREDAEHYWDTFQPSGIENPGLSLVLEDEDDAYPGTSRVGVTDETDATVKIEDIEKIIQNGGEDSLNGEPKAAVMKEELDQDAPSVNGEHEPNVDNKETKSDEAKINKPRKAMLIKNDDLDYLDAGFEMVSESDLGEQTGSETSSINDSTGTHTIALSTAETTEASETSENSRQETSEDTNRESMNSKHDLTDETKMPSEEEVSVQQIEGFGENKENTEMEDVFDSEKRNVEVIEMDEAAEEQSDVMNVTDKESKTETETETDILRLSTQAVPETLDNTDTAKSTDPDNSLESIEFKYNVSKSAERLTLSAENIFLEPVPSTPIVVPDSIIFESESSSPVHLDDVQVTPQRQRRAHTIECVMGSLQSAKENQLVVKKDWHSFDDIDKMTNSKGSVALFEPIHKIRAESPKMTERNMEIELNSRIKSDNEITIQNQANSLFEPESQITMESPVLIEQAQSFVDRAQTAVEEIKTYSTEITNNLMDTHTNSLPNETISRPQEDNINSSLSLSFEVLDDGDTVDKHSHEVFEESSKPDHSYALFPSSNDKSDVFIPSFAEAQTAGVTLSENMHVTVEESNVSLSGDPSIEIIDPFKETHVSEDKCVFANIDVPNHLTNPTSDEEHSMTESDIKDGIPESNNISDITQIDETNVTPSLFEVISANIPESQLATGSTVESSFLEVADANKIENSSTGSMQQSFNLADESDIAQIENQNEDTTKPSQRHANDISLLVDCSEVEVSKDSSDSDIKSAGTFQQFQNSFLNASTPTSSAVNNPLVEFKPDLNEFDAEFQNISNNNSDSFESFNLADATQILDKSFDEDTFQRLTTESTSTHSFELIPEGSDKTSLENIQPKKRITVAFDSLETSDKDDEEEDDSSEESDSGDFTNILMGLDGSSKSAPNSLNISLTPEPVQSPDTNFSVTGNVSWEVLGEDTEA